MTHSALASLLAALAWWRTTVPATGNHAALYRHAAAADAAVVLTEVHNCTGEALQMWMDFGDATKVAEVARGAQRLMQPLVRPVARGDAAAAAGRARLPAMLLAVTLGELTLEVRGAVDYYPSTAKVWQTLNIGKSPRVPNNLIISGADHGQL